MGLSMYPLSFLGKGSVNTFPQKGRTAANVVFCAVHAVSKERMQSVLIRTSCSSYSIDLAGKKAYYVFNLHPSNKYKNSVVHTTFGTNVKTKQNKQEMSILRVAQVDMLHRHEHTLG